jgi:ubiquinone/menaquinone biosynthesis C-methylase UbiE
MTGTNGLQLDRVVFIGRTYFEYLRMFDLNESALRNGRVLDCAAGPSSFTAEARNKGVDVTACDTLYDMPAEKLADRGRKDIEHTYVWKHYKDRQEIIGLRHKALGLFEQDYPDGFRQGRYISAELPRLPFPDRTFRLVLSSHFLFLYGDRLNIDFHVASFKEMARVSYSEVRVYPLQGLDAKPYPYMDEVLKRLRSEGIQAEIVSTPFEFQRGATKMLRLNRRIG